MDGSAFNSTPYDRMQFTASMAKDAGRDAVVIVDFSLWFKSAETIVWPQQVDKAAAQLARANAAINVVTGNKPTLNAYSGVAEAFIKIGEKQERGELPPQVRDNLGFSNVVLSAYPFRQGGVIKDVTVPDALLNRIDGHVVNFYSSAFANNKLATNAKMLNVLGTDSQGHAIRHENFNDVILPNGQTNPVLPRNSPARLGLSGGG